MTKDKGELQNELKTLKVFVDRAKKDLMEEDEEYEKLKSDLAEVGGE